MRDDSHVHENHFIEILAYGLQIMVDDKAGLATLPQILQQANDGCLSGGIHGSEGFVHQVEIRVLDERTGKECALLLAAGKLADLAVREIRDADPVERLHGRILVAASDRAAPTDFAVTGGDGMII